MTDRHERLRHQSLQRPLTDAERALADAMEACFAEGCHDFAALAETLQARDIAAPSGDKSPWTVAKLEAELAAVNRSLDQAYAGAPAGA